jgi:antitoxin component of RelBE/YafQ-DinJ toxin-antitoxin module
MKDKTLTIRASQKLKDAFQQICTEREVSASDLIRDYMAREVRNFQRKGLRQ